MKPGRSVASPRSMTSELAGISALEPTPRILSPRTTTMPGETTRSEIPSDMRAARSTMGRDWAQAKEAVRRRERKVFTRPSYDVAHHCFRAMAMMDVGLHGRYESIFRHSHTNRSYKRIWLT